MLREEQDHRSGKLFLLFALYEAGGLQKPDAPVGFNVSLTPQQYETAARDGIVLHQSVAVGAGVKKVRVIVVDGELGSAGSVTIPIEH